MPENVKSYGLMYHPSMSFTIAAIMRADHQIYAWLGRKIKRQTMTGLTNSTTRF